MLAKFKLVECLPEKAVLRHFEWLAWEVSESRLGHGVGCSHRRPIEKLLLAAAARVEATRRDLPAHVALRGITISNHLMLASKLWVEADANTGCLAT